MNNQLIGSRYNIDFSLLSSTFALVGIGLLFIYSADNAKYFENQISISMKQLIALIVGVVLFVFFLLINYQRLVFYKLWFFFAAVVMLLAVLFVGIKIHGSRSWFSLVGGFALQPSEIAKLLFIFILASQIERVGENIQRIPYLIGLLLVPVPIIALILLQPDAGTALVFVPITLCMLLVGGAKLEHLLFMILIGLLSLSFAVWSNHTMKEAQKLLKNNQFEKIIDSSILFRLAFSHSDIEELRDVPKESQDKEHRVHMGMLQDWLTAFNFRLALFLCAISVFAFFMFRKLREPALKWVSIVLLALSLGIVLSVVGQILIKPHHVQRLIVIFDLDKDPLGASYHQRQSIIAIGSGGVTGYGWRKGPQNNLDYIPEKTNDFIFAVIAEEWGFFRGTLLVFMLFTVLLYRGLVIAYSAKDSFGVFIAVGITSMFFAHILINLGMVIGFLPVMGLPLPFLSAGGSSLITNLIAVALLLNISRRRFVC